MMSTTMPKADMERKWYVIDAADKPLGRVAAQAATLLRGKHKTTFAPHADCGDFVIIINTDKAVLTGGKIEKKMYQHHTGYIGHLKEVSYKTLMAEKSDFAMLKAVKGMLPDTTLGRKQLTRCRVFKGADHKHQAQKPEAWEM
ncbi:MAG TPA: 50S ribosomal protein L13 [Candidatus Scubalenecus merdavium]|uniref:Large ribosomal subunit protein uL13 n=1 Tax=Candidatus Scybalenecus merdavium TaxID=2840939 RepID=A0A9D1MUN4_9FIRM|nr:50S ribosomal protein L13 [Candidatus Scubalenecus merdavium]